MCTGQTWFRVPETVLVELAGIKPPGISGKDVFLAIAEQLGSVEGRAIELSPNNLEQLSIDERSTVATMCAELSAEFAVFPADDVLLAYLAERTSAPFTPAPPTPMPATPPTTSSISPPSRPASRPRVPSPATPSRSTPSPSRWRSTRRSSGRAPTAS